MPNPNCEVCHGTGTYTITIGGDGYGDKCCGTMDCDDQPCQSCDDYPTPAEEKLQAEMARDCERAIKQAKVWDEVFDKIFRHERNSTGVDRRHWADKPQENDDAG
jgi:hypothetical protein